MLDNTVKFYVPSTQASKQVTKVKHKARLQEVQEVLTQFFGGATATLGLGSWFSEQQLKTVFEDVYVIECKASNDSLEKSLHELEAVANWYRLEWQQESVAYEVNGKMLFSE